MGLWGIGGAVTVWTASSAKSARSPRQVGWIVAGVVISILLLAAAIAALSGPPGASAPPAVTTAPPSAAPIESVPPSPSASAPPKTEVQQFGESWDTWFEQNVASLTGVLAWWVGWIVATLLIARVITSVAHPPWTGSTRRRRAVWISTAVVLGVASPVAWILAAQGDLWWAFPLILLLGLLGCLGLAMWIGGRMRVTVQVRDDSGDASERASVELASYVRDIGSSPPEGLRTPEGTDLSALGEAASSLSSSKVTTFILGTLDALLNISPWKVEVTLLDTATAVMNVRRNERLVFAERIETAAAPYGQAPGSTAVVLTEPEKVRAQAVTLKAVAAYVAVALAREHPDMTGLYGATDPQSVALQYLATTTFLADTQRSKKLLRYAEGADRENLLAITALRDLQFPDDDRPYLQELRGLVDRAAALCSKRSPFARVATSPARRRHPEPDLLLLRLLTSYVAVGRNWMSGRVWDAHAEASAPRRSGRPSAGAAELDEVRYILDALEALISALRECTDDTEGLIQRMRSRAVISVHRLNDLAECAPWSGIPEIAKRLGEISSLVPSGTSSDWWRDARDSTHRDVQYDLACYYANHREPHPTLGPGAMSTSGLRRAVELISLRLQDDADAQGHAWTDPELRPLRDQVGAGSSTIPSSTELKFRKLTHPDTPTQFWQVTPLKTHEMKLKAAGMMTIADLAGAKSIHRLREHLGVSDAEYTTLVDAAALGCVLAGDAALGNRAPEILSILVENGLGSVDRVRRQRSDDRAKLTELLAAELDSLERPPTTQAIGTLIDAI